MANEIVRQTDFGPGLKFFAVTPSDATDYAGGYARALYVGGAGNVVVVDVNGNAVTFTAVPAGTVLAVWHKRINSTSTTATNMVAIA